jgi:hypothetical protein
VQREWAALFALFNTWEVVVITFIWRNFWLRYAVLIGAGLFIWMGGLFEMDEARTYKDGPKATDISAISQDSLEYDYLTLTGLNDGSYVYSYIKKDDKTANSDVDLSENIILYYALLKQDQYDVSINNEQSSPTVLVRQILPEADKACVETESCLTGDEMRVQGRLMKETDSTDQKEFEELAKTSLYTISDQTLYFDADWEPTTSSSAGITKGLGITWTSLAALALAFNLYLRRKKATTLASQAADERGLQSHTFEEQR